MKPEHQGNNVYQWMVLNAEVIQQLFGASKECLDLIGFEKAGKPQISILNNSEIYDASRIPEYDEPISSELGCMQTLARRRHTMENLRR